MVNIERLADAHLIKKMLSKFEDYKAFQQIKYTYGYYQSTGSDGILVGLEFVSSCFDEYKKNPEFESYQFSFVELLQSNYILNEDREIDHLLLKYIYILLEKCGTIEPKDIWSDLFNPIISKLNKENTQELVNFNCFLFRHYRKFSDEFEARKYCTYERDIGVLSNFLFAYGKSYLKDNERGMLISQAVLNTMRDNSVAAAKTLFQSYIEMHSKELKISCVFPFGDVFINYTHLLLDAVERANVNYVKKINKFYFPYLKKFDPDFEKTFNNGIEAVLPSYNTNNQQNTASLTNIARNLFGRRNANTSQRTTATSIILDNLNQPDVD